MSTLDDDGYATLEALTAPALDEEDYVLESGAKVRIRPLSRDEVLRGQQLRDTGLADMEAYMIGRAMVRPKLRTVDVRAWMKAVPCGDLEPLTRRINHISGLDQGADTAAYERFRNGSVDGVRSLPGAEAVDDGGRDAPADS